MSGWKTLTAQSVYTCGKWLSVEDRTVETPDGQVIEHWAWVKTPDFVIITAVMEDGQVLLFKQGKYGLEGDSLAPIGGYIEPGELPAAAAVRELREETGCEARQWIDLGHFLVDPNRGYAWGHFFLALGARQVTAPSGGDLEAQEPVLMSAAAVEDALLAGQFRILAWANGAALALFKLRQMQI